MAIKKFDCVDYEQDGPVAVIRMSNPARRNSLSFLMRRGLNGAFGLFEEDDDAKVAILTGMGNSFCSGVDTKDQLGLSDEQRRSNAAEMRKLQRAGAYEHLNRIPKPIIAAVNGFAIGYGWFVANQCDLVVAAESALFWQNEPLFGYQGGGGAIAAQGMPFHIGTEMTLAFKFTARRCYEVGLVNRVVPDTKLMDEAMSMARHIADLAPLSVQTIVRACRDARLSTVVPSSVELAHWIEFNVLGKTEDVREGFTAFAEKRKPVWKGR